MSSVLMIRGPQPLYAACILDMFSQMLSHVLVTPRQNSSSSSLYIGRSRQRYLEIDNRYHTLDI